MTTSTLLPTLCKTIVKHLQDFCKKGLAVPTPQDPNTKLR